MVFSGKKLKLTIFAHFSIFFIKKRSNLTMFSLSRLASLEHSFRSVPVLKVNGSCIDLILPNRMYSFKSTSSTDTILSDHLHLISSMMKTAFEKEEPEVFNIPGLRKICFQQFEVSIIV